jgi:GH15 family glucan-1,4-alpha-glucosidase
MAERFTPGVGEQDRAVSSLRHGFAAIEDYAVLGDGRTVALVATDGQIDWWPVPTMDAPPVFSAILDPTAGGYLEMRPAEDFTTERRYLPGTNVLETTFRSATGAVRVTDALSVGAAGPLPWGELARRVEGVEGTVDMTWTVAPGTRFDSAQPWTETWKDAIVVHVGDQHLGVLGFDVGETSIAPHQVSGRFTASPGSVGLLAVTCSDAEPLFLPQRAELDHHLDRTIERWREWTQGIRYDGQWSDAVIRSALALKLLLYSPTGAIAAAPTTSLPERIGGDKNWDYRYMWVRDSSYTVDALMELGLHEEVQSAVSFLLSAIRRTAPNLHVFYTLAGDVPTEHAELDAPGYRESTPVRAGNGAATQTQLGTSGDLFDTMWHYVDNGHQLDAPTGRMLAELADRCCDIWRRPDSGIWELPDARQYTISKMGCWVALDRAAKLAEAGAIHTGHTQRWRSESDEIRAWVNENCWSTSKGSYTFYAGTDDLDAATLLAGHTGFDRGERLAGTIDAITAELAEGPLIYRYTGMSSEEGAFVACSFWLVTALTHLGRTKEAIQQMDDSVALANDVGLLSEQMTPTGRGMLGNHPQGLSHLALVNAATGLAAATQAD